MGRLYVDKFNFVVRILVFSSSHLQQTERGKRRETTDNELSLLVDSYATKHPAAVISRDDITRIQVRRGEETLTTNSRTARNKPETDNAYTRSNVSGPVIPPRPAKSRRVCVVWDEGDAR